MCQGCFSMPKSRRSMMPNSTAKFAAIGLEAVSEALSAMGVCGTVPGDMFHVREVQGPCMPLHIYRP